MTNRQADGEDSFEQMTTKRLTRRDAAHRDEQLIQKSRTDDKLLPRHANRGDIRLCDTALKEIALSVKILALSATV